MFGNVGQVYPAVPIRKVTGQNLAIIRRHVAVRRAESRARLRSTKRSAGNCAAPSAIASRN